LAAVMNPVAGRQAETKFRPMIPEQSVVVFGPAKTV
jgi:hypothetical protein